MKATHGWLGTGRTVPAGSSQAARSQQPQLTGELTWRPLALMARRGAPAPLGARLCDRLCFGTVALPREGDLLDGLVVGPVADPGAADAKRLESVSMKRKLSFIYIFSMVCLGLCYGAQCVHALPGVAYGLRLRAARLGWLGVGWGRG